MMIVLKLIIFFFALNVSLLPIGIYAKEKVLGFIPAYIPEKDDAFIKWRRMPGKPLFLIEGKPLLYHICKKAKSYKGFDQVYIVTNSKKIQGMKKEFECPIVFKNEEATTGSDRIADAISLIKEEFDDKTIIINIQVDNLSLSQKLISDLVLPFLKDEKYEVATLFKKENENTENIANENFVKIVRNLQDEAIYFSRSKIPYYRPAPKQQKIFLRHIGLYAFRYEGIKKFHNWEKEKGLLEQAERLEQLRFIEHGIPIKLYETTEEILEIKTIKDIENKNNKKIKAIL